VRVAASLQDALRNADAVMTLRVQLERAAGGGIPSLREYTRGWGLDEERMDWARPGAPVLHPGPTNEGIELTAELAASERSLIGQLGAPGLQRPGTIGALVLGEHVRLALHRACAVDVDVELDDVR